MPDIPKINNVYVDDDITLNLETESLYNKFLASMLNSMPVSFRKFIKKTDEAASSVLDNITNHDALETLYSKGKRFKSKKLPQKIFQSIWFSLNNSKAVRNRLKFVSRELQLYLKGASSSNKEISIMSIASGSSRAIIEVIEKGDFIKPNNLSVTFLDKNPHAIDYSKRLSKNITHFNLKWINDTVGNFFKNESDQKFDIVEIVGLFDYFEDEKVLETLKSIFSVLKKDGIVITANINHNNEKKFIHDVIGWKMIYRTAEELENLVKKAGFLGHKVKVFYEPIKIHSIVIAQK